MEPRRIRAGVPERGILPGQLGVGGYRTGPADFEEYRHPRLKGLVEDWIRVPPGGRVLEVGCGVGWFLFSLDRRLGAGAVSFTGLDVTEVNIRWLAERAREENKINIMGALGDAEGLPFPDGHFDAIVCSEVIEHIYHPETALREIARCLKPGGRLYLTTPSRIGVNLSIALFAVPRALKQIFRRGQGFANRPYDRPLYSWQLRRLLREAGFDIRRFRMTVFTFHESYFQFFPGWMRRIILGAARFSERWLYGLLKGLALQMVVEAEKPGMPEGGRV